LGAVIDRQVCRLRRAFDLISHRPARELRYVSPHARPLWLRCLHAAFGRWNIEAASSFRMITLLNGTWRFGDGAWDFDLNRIKRQISAILTSCNYVAATEFTPFRNHVMADTPAGSSPRMFRACFGGRHPDCGLGTRSLSPASAALIRFVCWPSGRLRAGLPVRLVI
jgi:hypothetical protein